MNIRKLLDWRKLLIYSHRWLGIGITVMFLVWTLSGVVLMYYGHPQITTGERLLRFEPINFSTATVTPAEAAAKAGIKPYRVRLSMYNGRPVYRLTRVSIGNWSTVYADTGEVLPPMGREQALNWMKRFAPEYASTMNYDAYLESPDEFTRIPTLAGFAPLHRIAMNDPAGTEYYVSERSNEIVQKTDRRGRILAISGYVLHNLFFFRQRSWWTPMLDFIAWTAMLMVVTGVVVGIWRVAFKPRFRHKGALSYTPYSGWMKWHHYAGLIFGLFSISWILSGMIPISTFPIPGWTQVSKRVESNGEGFIMGTPTISPRSTMTREMARSITGGPLNLQPLRLADMRNAIAKITFDIKGEKFAPKELELIQFRGEPYFLAYQPPTTKQEAEHWTTNNAINIVNLPQDNPHLFVSIRHPEDGVRASFSKEVMEQASREAMPNVPVIDSQWLTDYDDYYHQTTTSFELGRHKPAYVLPVLRVRYDDKNQTWLYFTPSLAQMVKFDKLDRANRWAYYGLHVMDFPGLFRRRPLWDILTIALLAGLAAISVTTLLPAFRRLKRHVIHAWKWVFAIKKVRTGPNPGWAVSDSDRMG
jgi:PepSY-associated TM region